MKSKVLYIILLGLLHLLVCIFAGAIGWHKQTVIVPVISIIVMVIANRKLILSPLASFAVVSPYFLLFTILLSKTDVAAETYPIFIFGILVSLLTFLFLEYKVSPRTSIVVLSSIVMFDGLFAWPNTVAYLHTEVSPGRYRFDSSQIVDMNGNNISLEELKGKVVLFDIWSSSCSYCIKQFPEVQKLYDKYKDDTLVRIITLNMPLKRDSSFNPSRFLEKYSFDKMFFRTEDDWKKLPIDGVPLTLIMNKKMICQYAGPLNTDWNIFINNANGFIKGLKDEKE
jgi:thiol-disulfide isomerase/thioredoxin